MAEKSEAGGLMRRILCFALVCLLSGCVVTKETYQVEYNRANDFEAKSEDLEARLRDKAENERKLERRTAEAEARSVEAARQVKLAQVAAEEAKTALVACKRERADISGDVDVSKKTLREAEEQIRQLKTKVRELEERVKEVKSSGDALTARQSISLETMRSKLADLSAERDVLTEQVAKVAAVSKEKEEAEAKEQERLLALLKDEIENGRLTATTQNGRILLKLQDELLFSSGSVELKAEGKKMLAYLAKTLGPETGYALQVAGHSDNVKLGGSLAEKYHSNWELSAARAVAVVKYLMEKEGLDGQRLSAAGYGEYSPVADNSTKEGRAKNRRIEIKLLPLAPGDETPESDQQPPHESQAPQAADPDEAGQPTTGMVGEPNPDGVSPTQNPAEQEPVEQKSLQEKPVSEEPKP